MAFDAGTLPISPTFLLACAAYAGVSLVGTGPLIAKRMIDTSGWMQSCPAALKASIENERPRYEAIPQAPTIDCRRTLAVLLPDAQELCDLVDGLPRIPDPNAQAAKARNAAKQAQNRSLDRLAAVSGARCSCAATALQERERASFAVLAGSARLITPPVTRDLQSGLITALNSAPCNTLQGV